MQKLINQRTTRYTQRPWAVYPELLQAINLHIVVDAHSYPIFYNFEAKQLRECNFEITFQDWDVGVLQANPQISFADLFLVVTIEDTSVWQSCSELIKIDSITNSSKFAIKPKFRLAAYEGLVFCFRIISKSKNQVTQKTLKPFSVIAEREIILHTENNETNFEIRIVDKLTNQRNPNATYGIVFMDNVDPFTQPISDCVYVEILKDASDKHVIAHSGGAGALVDALFVANITSEIVFSLKDFLATDDAEAASGIGSPNSMVERICKLFEYQTVGDLSQGVAKLPQDIFEKSRELSKLAAAYSSVRK